MDLLEQSGSGVPHSIGRATLSEHGPQRRIVWVPTTGRFDVPKGAKHQVDTQQTGKPLALIPLFVEAYVFGPNRDLTWLLFQNLINAAELTLDKNAVRSRWAWLDQEPGNASVNPNTACILQIWEWRLVAWSGILPLPADSTVDDYVLRRQQQTMLTFQLPTQRLVTDPNQAL